MILQSHSWVYIQKRQNLSFENVHTPSVHSSTIDNCQAMEAIEGSINRLMNKDVAYTCTHTHTHTHTVKYYSDIKNKILSFAATWKHGWIRRTLCLMNKSERKRQILYHITYMWNLKNITN